MSIKLQKTYDEKNKKIEEKNINIKINNSLYTKVKVLAAILESQSNKKIQINELMNEAMELLLEEYQSVIQEELSDFIK